MMTPKQESALRLALETFERMGHKDSIFAGEFNGEITAIREALAEQPAQPSKPWVGLTDEERGQAINANFGTGLWAMAKDIEAKLREKNA